MPSFTCSQCGEDFQVPQAALDRYPGWKPRQCRRCKPAKTAPTAAGGKQRSRRGSSEANLSVAEVLDKYTEGPTTGVFTDGAADPNPGPGGWGAVYVVDDRIVDEAHGHEPHTTNNRMELTALVAGYRMVPRGRRVIVWSDSELCVNTITKWAASWAARGWRRKGGEIKNLELVQELYGLARERPEIELRWIKAHSGLRWNEYADALATAYRRGEK